MTLIFLACLVALAFEFINGFHDTANAIATSVSTKVLTPRQAITLAASTNLLGALVGTSVAATIGTGLVDAAYVTPQTIFCALLGAVAWNLFTWRLGLPASSSHALIGGLCGATLASADGRWAVIRWSARDAAGRLEGLWPKVIAPMIASPLLGIMGGLLVMLALFGLLYRQRPHLINRVFGRLQVASAAFMGFSHGTNDAQKTMGILTLILFAGTQGGALDGLPAALGFLRTPVFRVAFWVKLLCALTMAAGTAMGGWRIIRTLGHKMVRLQPIHGFAAETTAAAIIQMGSHWGIPLSTTHVITAAIMGVGATKRWNSVKWGLVGQMAWAWLLTLPVTGLLGYALERALLLAR